MADSDKINLLKRKVSKQTELIDLFDEWVQKIKANELPEASEIVKKSNIIRIEISKLKKQYEMLNKRSGIILTNQIKGGN
jgi:hypothetical protein